MSRSELRGRQCVKGRVPLHSLPLTLPLTHCLLLHSLPLILPLTHSPLRIHSPSIHFHSPFLSHTVPLHSLTSLMHCLPLHSMTPSLSRTVSPSPTPSHPPLRTHSHPPLTPTHPECRVRVCAREGEREWVKGETVHEREGEWE